MRALPLVIVMGFVGLGCPTLPEAPCQVAIPVVSPYLVQLRPVDSLPEQCPQGQQYQVLMSSIYWPPESSEPATVVFMLPLSTVEPPSAAQALGRFETFRALASGVCRVDTLTPATDDAARPTNAPVPVGAVTYALSEMEVLSDTAHQGTQFQANLVVDYGIPGCNSLKYVAQGVAPVTSCLNDSVCLPDVVATEPWAPAGRGVGSGLPRDNRAFCNMDPALLDNSEVNSQLWVGREAYQDPNDGSLHDVGICFYSEPFPSLCPPGSTLSTTGACVVGPGSNPH